MAALKLAKRSRFRGMREEPQKRQIGSKLKRSAVTSRRYRTKARLSGAMASMVTSLCYSCEIISRAAAASRGRFERVEAFQYTHDLHRAPLAVAARGRNALLIQARCDGSQ